MKLDIDFEGSFFKDVKFETALTRLSDSAKFTDQKVRIAVNEVSRGWMSGMREVVPVDKGFLKASLRIFISGGPDTWELQLKSLMPYAAWVARGTLDSPKVGQPYYAADYGHKYFGYRGDRGKVYGKGDYGNLRRKFFFQGQKSQPYDIEGFNNKGVESFDKAVETLARQLFGDF